MSIKAFAASVCAALLMLVSCQEKAPSFYDLTITLDESGFSEGIPSPGNYQVIFSNTNTGEMTTVTSEGTKVSAKQLVAGVYDIVATAQFKIYNYIGAASSVTIDSAESLKTLPIKASVASSLIFKEISYSCTKSSAGAVYLKDNFFEIYNNGESVIFLDGFCIGTTTNYSSTTISLANDKGNMEDPDGKDLGIKAADYLVFNGSNAVVWQIPGDGKTYPLSPGESVILASSAVDHTQSCDKSINLESCEFETFCDKYKEKGQVDNPKAINLTLINPLNQNITNQYMPSNQSAGLCLFYLDTDPAKLPVVSEVSTHKLKFIAIKRSMIFDAVSYVKNSTTLSFLPSDLDAGKIWCSGINVGESIVRKVKETTKEGIKIYADTNNTTNDFEVSTTPTIRRNGSAIPSWSQAKK